MHGNGEDNDIEMHDGVPEKEAKPTPVDGTQMTYSGLLSGLQRCQKRLETRPYCIDTYISIARKYSCLGYPDLAAGAAYKALLLADAVCDAADDYHDLALDDVLDRHERPTDVSEQTYAEEIVTSKYLLPMLVCLRPATDHFVAVSSCFRTAFYYYTQAIRQFPDNKDVEKIHSRIRSAVAKQLQIPVSSLNHGEYSNLMNWPNQGFARRERYPWSKSEPDRMKEIDDINDMMSEFAPKLEVRAVDLPVLSNSTEGPQVSIVQQLGVFTKEDIAPGEVILHETSMITANNKLQDALCDACSGELPELDSDDADKIVTCRHCEVVFCSEYCHYHAQQEYHPALCGRDVEAIAKNVPASEAADSLYALLLLRTYAMARTMELENPLQLCEVRYLWGDFHNLNIEENWRAVGEGPKHSNIPRTLPFSFENNVKLPYHLLEKMDIDIFAGPHYDVWIFNTLYAKFRGTASARLSGSSGGAIRGPEVSAVHPMWCLANHSCDPNVSWEWGGSIKLWAREERPVWQKDGQSNRMTRAGIAKGKEVLNHYCDINLPVKERREWARGALGGDCQCVRCKWEADEAPGQR